MTSETSTLGTTADTGSTLETLTLGGGCFWCLEAVYLELDGVVSVVSGYAGGRTRNPSYKLVTTGTTGHAEVVDVTFDTNKLSRDQLLDVFFAIHDPTTPNRQGNDVGPQYRSIVLYRDEAQKHAAEQAISRAAASGEWRNIVVTEVVPLEVFYPAEDYHQQYFAQHGQEPYCSLVVAPKVAKFRKRFGALLRR
jgi:peptide-methionine (S)-S-oxide reductase